MSGTRVTRAGIIRGAHVTRVLARRPAERTFSAGADPLREDGFGGSPKPARESRALPRRDLHAFTIIELLVVMAIIIVLAGLILATSGYVQKKGARSRAEAEIAAMSAALESYKADNGVYPRDTTTDNVNPTGSNNAYANSSRFLYGELAGDKDWDRVGDANTKSYFNFKPSMLLPAPPSTSTVTAIRDPFGNSYGYSTMKAADPTAAGGYNPTFDLWSTAGTPSASAADQAQWIKNW